MECASRALSFWSYQATQEILYQEHMAKNWNVKASELTADVENILNEANTEISGLQNKLAGLQLDKEGLERKHSEVVEALKEKTKKHRQTQELYDKLKRKTLYSQVQTATSEIVEQAANDDNAMMGELFVDDGYGDTGNQRSFGAPRAQHQQPQQGPFVYDQNHPQLRTERETVHGDEGNMAPPIMRRGPGIQIGANQNFRSKPQALSPSRRVSLSNEGRRNVNSGFAATPNSHVGGLRSSTLQNMTPKHRQPLMTRNNNPQRTPSIAGYGMSAGMKVGRSFDGSVNHQEQNKLGDDGALPELEIEPNPERFLVALSSLVTTFSYPSSSTLSITTFQEKATSDIYSSKSSAMTSPSKAGSGSGQRRRASSEHQKSSPPKKVKSEVRTQSLDPLALDAQKKTGADDELESQDVTSKTGVTRKASAGGVTRISLRAEPTVSPTGNDGPSDRASTSPAAKNFKFSGPDENGKKTRTPKTTIRATDPFGADALKDMKVKAKEIMENPRNDPGKAPMAKAVTTVASPKGHTYPAGKGKAAGPSPKSPKSPAAWHIQDVAIIDDLKTKYKIEKIEALIGSELQGEEVPMWWTNDILARARALTILGKIRAEQQQEEEEEERAKKAEKGEKGEDGDDDDLESPEPEIGARGVCFEHPLGFEEPIQHAGKTVRCGDANRHLGDTRGANLCKACLDRIQEKMEPLDTATLRRAHIPVCSVCHDAQVRQWPKGHDACRCSARLGKKSHCVDCRDNARDTVEGIAVDEYRLLCATFGTEEFQLMDPATHGLQCPCGTGKAVEWDFEDVLVCLVCREFVVDPTAQGGEEEVEE
ncbi:MAG: hypothetical protein M1833_001043 [Piccolia ochrophora]|nr:MAG: hypothetical protein M1833_001043 [Piccolia ochrophora]